MKNYVENIEDILNIFIAVIPFFLAVRDNIKKKDQSSFYSYIELYYENFVEKLTKKYKIEIFGVFSIQIVLILCYYLRVFDTKNIKIYMLISFGNIVLLLFAIAMLFTLPFCFKKSKKLDNLINGNGVNFYRWDRNLNIYISIICCIGVVLFFIIKPNNLNWAVTVIYITFVLSLCISGFYTYYVANYIKVRTFYHVDSISIKISSEEKAITNIINYKLKGDRYIIRINENGIYMSVEVPSSKIEYIEKKINKEKPMIKILNRGKDQK